MSKFADQIAQLIGNQTPAAVPVEPVTPEPVAPVVDSAPTPPVTPESVAPVAPVVPAEPVVTPEAAAQKPWYEDATDTTKTPPTPVEKNEKNEPVSPQLPEDPDFQLLKKFKEAGKNLADLISEYKVKDVSKLEGEKLVQNALKDFYNLEGDALEEEIVRYSTLSPTQKIEYENQLRKRYEDENSKKLNELINPIETMRKQNEENFAKVVELFDTDIESLVTPLVDQELYGLKVSTEMVDQVRKDMKDFGVVRPDGTFDTEKIFNAVFANRYLKDIVRANVTAAKNQGRQEVLAQVHNPSPNIPASVVPTTNTPDDAVRAYLDKKKSGR
jgi:hypothetical protein